MGYEVVRGSTFKQAIPAARSLIKILKREEQVVIVADGSRGPRHKVQSGLLQIAARTGAPVIPMSFDAQPKIELNSWDRFVLPLPFSKCILNFGSPIFLSREDEDLILPKKRVELEGILNDISGERS